MSLAKQLYELQELDLRIEGVSTAISQIEAQLGDDQLVVEAQRSLAGYELQTEELERQQRYLEWELQDLNTKVQGLEQRLYGGSVRNPRELASLQEEVTHLRTQRKAREDRLLDLMIALEASQADLAAQRAEFQRVTAAWQEERSRLQAEYENMRHRLADLSSARRDMASQLDSSSLALYETLRSSRQGQPTAKVERGLCQGCHISLSMAELQRARLGHDLVRCPSCGRILYVA